MRPEYCKSWAIMNPTPELTTRYESTQRPDYQHIKREDKKAFEYGEMASSYIAK